MRSKPGYGLVVTATVSVLIPSRVSARGEEVCCANVPEYEHALYRELEEYCGDDFAADPRLLEQANDLLSPFLTPERILGAPGEECGAESDDIFLFGSCAVDERGGVVCKSVRRRITTLCGRPTWMTDKMHEIFSWADVHCGLPDRLTVVVAQEVGRECCCQSSPNTHDDVLQFEYRSTLFAWSEHRELTTWAAAATESSAMQVLRPSEDTAANAQLPVAITAGGSRVGGAAAIVPGLVARDERRARLLSMVVRQDPSKSEALLRAERRRYNGPDGYFRYVGDHLQFSLSVSEAISDVDRLRDIRSRSAAALSAILWRSGLRNFDAFCAAEEAQYAAAIRDAVGLMDAAGEILAKFNPSLYQSPGQQRLTWKSVSSSLRSQSAADGVLAGIPGDLSRRVRDLLSDAELLSKVLGSASKEVDQIFDAPTQDSRSAMLRDAFWRRLRQCQNATEASFLLSLTGSVSAASHATKVVLDRGALTGTFELREGVADDEWLSWSGTFMARYVDGPDQTSAARVEAYSMKPVGAFGARATVTTRWFDLSAESVLLAPDYFTRNDGNGLARVVGTSSGVGVTMPVLQHIVLTSSAHIRAGKGDVLTDLVGVATIGWRHGSEGEVHALQSWHLTR